MTVEAEIEERGAHKHTVESGKGGGRVELSSFGCSQPLDQLFQFSSILGSIQLLWLQHIFKTMRKNQESPTWPMWGFWMLSQCSSSSFWSSSSCLSWSSGNFQSILNLSFEIILYSGYVFNCWGLGCFFPSFLSPKFATTI